MLIISTLLRKPAPFLLTGYLALFYSCCYRCGCFTMLLLPIIDAQTPVPASANSIPPAAVASASEPLLPSFIPNTVSPDGTNGPERALSNCIGGGSVLGAPPSTHHHAFSAGPLTGSVVSTTIPPNIPSHIPSTGVSLPIRGGTDASSIASDHRSIGGQPSIHGHTVGSFITPSLHAQVNAIDTHLEQAISRLDVDGGTDPDDASTTSGISGFDGGHASHYGSTVLPSCPFLTDEDMQNPSSPFKRHLSPIWISQGLVDLCGSQTCTGTVYSVTFESLLGGGTDVQFGTPILPRMQLSFSDDPSATSAYRHCFVLICRIHGKLAGLNICPSKTKTIHLFPLLLTLRSHKRRVPIVGGPVEGQNFNPARVRTIQQSKQIQRTCATLLFYTIDGFSMPRKCNAPSAWLILMLRH